MKTPASTSSLGFTLIELMITVAIVAILAAIALPSYAKFILRSNRTDAKSALLSIQAEQEKSYLQYRRYAKDDTELKSASTSSSPGLNYSTGTTSAGYYTLSLASTSGGVSDYTTTATATGNQVKDTDCIKLHIDNLGNKTSEDSGGNATTNCWNK